MWCIWKRRNQKILEDVEKDVCFSVQLAGDRLLQWREARRRNDGLYVNNNNNNNDIWLPPSVGEVTQLFLKKINILVLTCVFMTRGHFVKAKTTWFDGVLKWFSKFKMNNCELIIKSKIKLIDENQIRFGVLNT